MSTEIEQFRENMATREYKDYGAHCTWKFAGEKKKQW